MTAEHCAKCHGNEVQVWKNTPPFSRRLKNWADDRARMKFARIWDSVQSRKVMFCIDCHFTLHDSGTRVKAISGVSCESCHGASKDWINVHNEYGGPTATKDTETEQHRKERLAMASSLGMRNTQNLYEIASSCMNCHTVPNEKLVNVGGAFGGHRRFLNWWPTRRARCAITSCEQATLKTPSRRKSD